MISVIVPVYNVQNYLNKCIESIISQTFKDLEIILVNDGSTDKSGEICDFYTKKDNRIKVIHKKNGGLSDARNCGLEIAQGEYIAFLDSDDWIDENLYSTLYELINRFNADIAMCNFERVYEEDEILNHSEKSMERVYSNIEVLENIYTDSHDQMIVAWNKLYKKYLFNKKRYPKGKIHEDEFLTPLLFYDSNKIVYTEEKLIYYRQNPNSIMGSKFNIKRLDKLEAIDNRIKFLKEKNLDNLYNKAISDKISCIIGYYYKIQDSTIENKVSLMKSMKDELYKIKINVMDLSLKDNIKIAIFNLNPYIYKIIINYNKVLKF